MDGTNTEKKGYVLNNTQKWYRVYYDSFACRRAPLKRLYTKFCLSCMKAYSPSSHLAPPKNARVAELAMGQLLRSGGFPNGFPHKYDLDTTIGPWLYAFSGQIFNDGRIGRAGMPCISLTLALRKNRGNSLQS